jgi:molecular chaperone GrpE
VSEHDAHAVEDGGIEPDEAPPQEEADAGEAAESAEDALLRSEDRLRRALADLDNLRRRYAREVERERLEERTRVARLWLPVVDDLERALDHIDASEDGDPRAVIEGIRVVRDHALAVLAQLGFPRYDATGEPFDPRRHEAVSVMDSDAEPGTVAVTMQPGYGEGEVVLRPARVVVSRAGVPSSGGAETPGRA